MFCEESLGKIKFRAFRNLSVHKFYCLRALITLEQVNTTDHEWLKKRKKKRIFFSQTGMVSVVNFHCMQMRLVMSMRFISGDD